MNDSYLFLRILQWEGMPPTSYQDCNAEDLSERYRQHHWSMDQKGANNDDSVTTDEYFADSE